MKSVTLIRFARYNVYKMKHRFFVAVLLLLTLILSGMAPFRASAQEFSDGEMVSQDQYYDWLRSSNRTLRNRINDLDDDPVQNLPMPILFGVAPYNLSPNFGDPRSGGRTHEGEDILAPKGAPIISPTEAVVLSTGVWEGGGNYVSTANPGGERFVYLHLDWIADLDGGDVLKPGDLIGYVGNTGNAAGGPAHLHFEIRKDGPTNPYPRLKAEFSLAQKIKFVENILDDGTSKDEDEFVTFLAANYRSQFLAAQALGLALPTEIVKEMQRVPASGVVAAFPGDLTIGSRGSAVVALQNFLIARNTGPAARALAAAGATGNFGTITRSALIEYQKAVGITPADGYYGPLTQAYVQQTKPAAAPAAAPAPAPTAPAAPVGPGTLVPARDLKLGASGTDVIWLQSFLIAKNSGPAAAALKQAGITGYFGAVTQAALAEYQVKAGIAPATGYFGPVTRAYMTASGAG